MAHFPWLTLASALALLPLSGEGSRPLAHEPAAWRQSVTANLRPGDIVFRRGVGPLADAVAGASFSAAGRARWTHAGIVAQLVAGGPLYVVHAIDGRGVVADAPQRFFSATESSAGNFVRVEGGERAAHIALGFLGRPFDASLSTADQAALYCTELVFVSLRHAGVSLDVPLRRLPLSASVMFPDDLERVLGALISPGATENITRYSVPRQDFAYRQQAELIGRH